MRLCAILTPLAPHSTYIAHLHHTTEFASFAYATPRHLFYFSYLKAGVGLVLRVSCAFSTSFANPLRGSCVSESLSLCDTMRILKRGLPTFYRDRACRTLALSRLANFQRPRRALCGHRTCGKILAVTPCEFSISPAWRTLCGDRACRNALAVARCEF